MKRNLNRLAAANPSAEKGLGNVNQAYDPAKAGDGPAAKLWELLRRNPAFREDATWFANHLNDPAARHQAVAWIRTLVDDKSTVSRNFAGYVLRWFSQPIFFKPEKYLNEIFGAVVESVKENLAQQVFGPDFSRSDDEWQKYRGMVPADFMKLCPFYLQPNRHLWLAENENLWLKLLLPDYLKTEHPGVLGLSEGGFNLNTPWPQTPKLFRDHFSWLWANFDANAVNPYTGDRALLPRPAAFGPFGGYSLQDQSTKLHPRLHNEFVYVVPVCFHTEKSIGKLCGDFQARIEAEFDSFLVSKKKYNYFFGGPNPWEVFIYVRDRTTYTAPAHRTPLMSFSMKFTRQGSGKAILDFEQQKKARNEWGEQSKYKGHIDIWYGQMEQLMTSIYPGDDFEKVVSAMHPGWPAK